MRLRFIALICSLLAFAVAGCGSSKSPTTATTIDNNASLAVPTFASGTAMARIQNSGKLNVGTSYSQGAFSSNESGSLSGFDIELTQYIAQAIFGGTKAEAAQKINYVQAESNNRETFLMNGTTDIGVGAYQITNARKNVVDFAGPDYTAQAQAIVLATDKRTQAISDLNGRNVCVPTTSNLAGALNSAAPQSNVVARTTLTRCQDALTSGAVDAVVGYDWALAPVVKANSSLRLVASSFATATYGIGLKRGDTEFHQFLNRTVQSIEDAKYWQTAFASTLGATGVVSTGPPAIETVITEPSTSSSTRSTVAAGTASTTSLAVTPPS